jgi:hypothetical protein
MLLSFKAYHSIILVTNFKKENELIHMFYIIHNYVIVHSDGCGALSLPHESGICLSGNGTSSHISVLIELSFSGTQIVLTNCISASCCIDVSLYMLTSVFNANLFTITP